MKRKLLPLILIFIICSTFSYAQESNRIGLSGSIQANQFGILVPVWLGEKFVLAPAFDLKFAEKIGTDFGIAIAPRFYLKKEKFSPYFD
jgi:hypothetical protein